MILECEASPGLSRFAHTSFFKSDLDAVDGFRVHRDLAGVPKAIRLLVFSKLN